MERIYPQMWLEVSKEIREHLAKVFNLTRTGTSEIRNETVISDGYTIEDLGGITAEKMAEYVGYPNSFHILWAICQKKAELELNPPKIITELKQVIHNIDNPIPLSERFCDECDSKGIRHKSYCSKAKNYAKKNK